MDNNIELKNEIINEIILEKIINEYTIEEKIINEYTIEEKIINESTIEEKINKSTIKDKKKFEIDQDNKQRVSVGFQFIFELYRVITSSLLILFVPQMCIDHVCTISENLVWETSIYNAALVFNFISMVSLFIMYNIEIIRENRLIKYLDVNLELSNDNDNVGIKLKELPLDKSKKIYQIDRYYQLSSYIATFIYILNIIFSAVIVDTFYAGTQTLSTFITYVLFMAMKLYSVYIITSTDKNIFYSAYMKTNVQFNDLDPNYKIII